MTTEHQSDVSNHADLSEANTVQPTSGQSYTRVAIALHWLIAALIIGQVIGGVVMGNLAPGSSAQFQLYQLHKSFGIVVLLASLVRLGWRLTHKPPSLPADMKPWEARAAHATHILFYVLMIGVPLGGWALVSASPFAGSVPTYLFGVVPWPHLPFFDGVEDRKALAEMIAEMHELFAFATMGLLILHIGAALKHHFVSRDEVLAQMAPIFRRKTDVPS